MKGHKFIRVTRHTAVLITPELEAEMRRRSRKLLAWQALWYTLGVLALAAVLWFLHWLVRG